MNILAIDPGPEESAYVVMDSSSRIYSFGKIPNLQMVNQHGKPFDRVVIEMIASYGMPVGREVFETCVWIGRFMEAFGAERCDRLTRIEIKSHLCHSAKAKDGNIRQALIDRLGPPGTKRAPGGTYGISGDVWSALAVAVTWMDKHGGLLGTAD
jgi:hypothetical protein